MKTSEILSVKQLRAPQFWLLGIAASFQIIYMTLVWYSGDVAHLGMSALFLMAAGSMLWDKRRDLDFTSSAASNAVGALLLGFVLWQSALLVTDPIMRVLPFISAAGVALLASGFKGIRQYWQELTILFFMGVPSIVAIYLTDISPITAQVSAFMLWYAGFDVTLYQDVFINLPQGGVKVYEGCSGIESMTYLLGLSVLCLVMFPIDRIKRFFVPLVALAMGFLVNAVRVCVMAVLAASQKKEAFDYWHEGDGSLIFGAIAVFMFGFFYMFLLRQEQESGESNGELEGL